MGTRNLICVVKDGKYKVAQYGQWDGYPEGQGVGVLNFLRNDINKELFLNKLTDLSYITDDEWVDMWLEFGVDINNDGGWVSCDISDKFYKKYPECDRDTGSDILLIIQNSNTLLKLRNSLDFATDSLFCEWAYVIDFDKNTFEVYEGFNKEPLGENERFKELECDTKQYYPVRHVISFNLNNLPTKEEFLNNFKEDKDEDEDEEEIPLF